LGIIRLFLTSYWTSYCLVGKLPQCCFSFYHFGFHFLEKWRFTVAKFKWLTVLCETKRNGTLRNGTLRNIGRERQRRWETMWFRDYYEFTYEFGILAGKFAFFAGFKVTVYLQGCLARKRCSSCSLSCRYLNPISIKVYGAGYQTIPRILKENELSNFSRPLNASARITFRKLQVKANFVFRQFNFFLGFRAQSAWKTCLRFGLFDCSKKLQNIFEIGFKKCGVIVQKSLSKKKYFEIINSQTRFCSLYVKLATVQI